MWSFDLLAGQWRLCRVLESFIFEHVGEIVDIFAAGSRIESTYHHSDGRQVAVTGFPTAVRTSCDDR